MKEIKGSHSLLVNGTVVIAETAMGKNVEAQSHSDSDYVEAIYK